MGVVYAARDERLGRTVALKTMSALAADETARKRFWREARAAASVSHPNICQIYEIGEDEDELFIAMELLDGNSLADEMRQGPMNVSRAVPVGLGMLSALSARHAHGVIHRDLKPSNVFLTAHGVKLLDFGVARPELDDSPQALTAITQRGMLIGTPRYMAPELVTGDTVDARSDLLLREPSSSRCSRPGRPRAARSPRSSTRSSTSSLRRSAGRPQWRRLIGSSGGHLPNGPPIVCPRPLQWPMTCVRRPVSTPTP